MNGWHLVHVGGWLVGCPGKEVIGSMVNGSVAYDPNILHLQVGEITHLLHSLKLTAKAPENEWLEY